MLLPQITKRSLAVLVALTSVILHRYLIGLGLGRVALSATLAAALGSNLWIVGSQAMWQHGPAAFALVAAIAILHPTPAPWWRLVLAGLAMFAAIHVPADRLPVCRSDRPLGGANSAQGPLVVLACSAWSRRWSFSGTTSGTSAKSSAARLGSSRCTAVCTVSQDPGRETSSRG